MAESLQADGPNTLLERLVRWAAEQPDQVSHGQGVLASSPYCSRLTCYFAADTELQVAHRFLSSSGEEDSSNTYQVSEGGDRCVTSVPAQLSQTERWPLVAAGA